MEHYKFLFCRGNNSGDCKSGHTSDKTESKKDDCPPSSERVILGQASNPNKDEIPERGTRRTKGGGRVRMKLIRYNVMRQFRSACGYGLGTTWPFLVQLGWTF